MIFFVIFCSYCNFFQFFFYFPNEEMIIHRQDGRREDRQTLTTTIRKLNQPEVKRSKGEEKEKNLTNWKNIINVINLITRMYHSVLASRYYLGVAASIEGHIQSKIAKLLTHRNISNILQHF